MCCLNYTYWFNIFFWTLSFSCWIWIERTKTPSQPFARPRRLFWKTSGFENPGEIQDCLLQAFQYYGSASLHTLRSTIIFLIIKFQSTNLEWKHLVKLIFQVYKYPQSIQFHGSRGFLFKIIPRLQGLAVLSSNDTTNIQHTSTFFLFFPLLWSSCEKNEKTKQNPDIK